MVLKASKEHVAMLRRFTTDRELMQKIDRLRDIIEKSTMTREALCAQVAVMVLAGAGENEESAREVIYAGLNMHQAIMEGERIEADAAPPPKTEKPEPS